MCTSEITFPFSGEYLNPILYVKISLSQVFKSCFDLLVYNKTKLIFICNMLLRFSFEAIQNFFLTLDHEYSLKE